MDAPDQACIYPWALSTCNQRTTDAQLRGVRIPDVAAGTIIAGSGAGGTIGMVTGDFVEVCGGPDHLASFDSVATCFFIDTAHNIVEYLEVRLPTTISLRCFHQ
jgi:carnosine N-methyltransferase